MPNRVSRRDWIIAVSLGCFVSLMYIIVVPDTMVPFDAKQHMFKHHFSSASILHASVFDIAKQSEPYRNIGTMHMLYSFNFVEVASRDLQI